MHINTYWSKNRELSIKCFFPVLLGIFLGFLIFFYSGLSYIFIMYFAALPLQILLATIAFALPSSLERSERSIAHRFSRSTSEVATKFSFNDTLWSGAYLSESPVSSLVLPYERFEAYSNLGNIYQSGRCFTSIRNMVSQGLD